MDYLKLLALLEKEEGPKLDFKVKLNFDYDSGKKELAKDICAIANSRGGRGYMLFGIEDKTKEIVGIDANDFKEEQIQQVVATRIDPPVPISVEIISLNNKSIGIITIYNSDQRPHQLRDNGAFYTRRGSTTDIMRKEEIASMLQETGLTTYELLPLTKSFNSDLDNEKIKEFLLKSGLPLKIDNSILMSTGIISYDKDLNEYHPTAGGMLMFGKTPQFFLPHSVIVIYNFLNMKIPYYHISNGTLLDIIEDACNFIKGCIENKPFPFGVIEDLIGKSVIFRDYFDINNPIEIYINKKSIEIIHPGTTTNGKRNTPEKYVRKNMWLYLKAITIDNNNKYINKNINIYSAMRDYPRIKYFNIFSKNICKIIIPIEKQQK